MFSVGGERFSLPVIELPMYAAPLDRSAAPHWRASWEPMHTRVNTWVPYGRIVAREHPWFDRGEQALFRLRQAGRGCAVRVTDSNSSISLRVALPADELASALTRVAARGAIEIDDCRLALDPTTLRDGPDSTMKVIDGWLTMPWMFGRLDVTAAARPWSSTRADLVLAPARGHRVRYPRRWFAVGFTVAHELRRRFTLPTD